MPKAERIRIINGGVFLSFISISNNINCLTVVIETNSISKAIFGINPLFSPTFDLSP